ncbi:type VI secretion system-associated protein TagF [Nevskia sp.]|uniref:type VI secretion system-associated protein TagF n=1 Tax=Nevskia sp. TaxID=1929292 RepID=UPI0025F154DF|nr:type VI secretion system-associated protein TagF [Nevskia sp.]
MRRLIVLPGELNVGFHGKLPSAGDFVQRRLPPAFVSIWDRSFEHAVAESRQMLGADWTAAYRSSPVWRLLLSAGVIGPTPWAGVIGPGVDRVGRCFPLVIVRNLGADPQLPLRALAMTDWFDAAQRVLGSGLAGGMPVDSFDREVAALDRAFGRLPAAWSLVQSLDLRSERHWRMALPVETAGVGLLQTAWRRAIEGGPAALWWTDGGERVPASLMVTAGLPGARAYAGFLDASAAGPSWHTLGHYAAAAPAVRPAAASQPTANPVNSQPPVKVVDVLSELFPDMAPAAIAAAVDPDITVPGMKRAASPAPSAPRRLPIAPCARLQSSDGALTLIASDGGGRDPAQRAARLIAEALADASPASFGASLEPLSQRLLVLHQHLRSAADDLLDPLQADCAVAVATVSGSRASVLAVGAAQALLWRSAQLLPLVTGRAATAAAAALPGDDLDDLLFSSGAAPAGLGADRAPGFDRYDADVRNGDRLLLLTSPLLTGLPPSVLVQALALPTTIDAEARIAAAAGLPPDISAWPFAVIEVHPS